MANTLTIFDLRKAENDYATLSKIINDLSDFDYNNTGLTKKESENMSEALELLEKIQERLFTDAQKITNQYLKTYYAKKNKKIKRQGSIAPLG